MLNQKISTILGSTLIIVFAVTIGTFVWKYTEKTKMPATISDNSLMQQSNVDSSGGINTVPQNQSSGTKTNAGSVQQNRTLSKDCSGHEDEKRICKDGSLIDRFDFAKCVATLCSAGMKSAYYSPYIKKDQQVFYEGNDGALVSIDSADAKTFKLIGLCASSEMYGNFYGKDTHSIYAGSKELKGIDLVSFKYLGSFSTGDGVFPRASSVSIDKNSVYFGCGTLMSAIDKGSFQLLLDGYSKDKSHVYYLGSLLDRVDYGTFKAIGKQKVGDLTGSFALDKNNVYYEGFIVTGINPSICQKSGLKVCLSADWSKLIDYSSVQGN